MQFEIVKNKSEFSKNDTVFLIHDNFDDYGYCTRYYIYYNDRFIGVTKIGNKKLISLITEKNLPVERTVHDYHSYSINHLLDKKFESLSSEYYSLGQSLDFYKNVIEFISDPKLFFESLNDLAYIYDYNELMEMYGNDDCFKKSLLRNLHFSQIEQFYRVSNGQAELSKYNFEFDYQDEHINIDVDPYSTPPSNIHVIIGRNGVGKTFLLVNMICSILKAMNHQYDIISEKYINQEDFKVNLDLKNFAGIIGVSFSIFDDGLSSIQIKGFKSDEKDLQDKVYKYIGAVETRRISDDKATSLIEQQNDIDESNVIEDEENLDEIEETEELREKITELEEEPIHGKINYKYSKSYDELREEFISSIRKIKKEKTKRYLYVEMCRFLSFDIMLKDNSFNEVIELYLNIKKGEITVDDKKIGNFFNKLSSGHMIIVLSLTRICEALAEKTIVFIDEPELHLHPPLLSTYIRALSFILRKMNAVGIIATHSPIVLQEVPETCVTKIVRKGTSMNFIKLDNKTFASSTDVITREVFGYDILQSGFYKMLEEELMDDFDTTMEKFSNKVGMLGQMLVLKLLEEKRRENQNEES